MASLGVSQRYAQGGAGAFVEYGGVKDYACLDSFEVATLFLKDGGAPVAAPGAAGSGEAVAGEAPAVDREEPSSGDETGDVRRAASTDGADASDRDDDLDTAARNAMRHWTGTV